MDFSASVGSRFSDWISFECADGFDVGEGFFPDAAFADMLVCGYPEVAGGGLLASLTDVLFGLERRTNLSVDVQRRGLRDFTAVKHPGQILASARRHGRIGRSVQRHLQGGTEISRGWRLGYFGGATAI